MIEDGEPLYDEELKECPKCGSKKVKYFGTGTQKLEDVINKEFHDLEVSHLSDLKDWENND